MTNALEQFETNDLKLVYTLLHGHLPAEPELMDSDLLQSVQTLLQRRATDAGVDVSAHQQWAAWLADRN